MRLAFISIFHAGVANLLDRARLGALQPLLGLRALELRPRVVRLLGALANRIRHADADAPTSG